MLKKVVFWAALLFTAGLKGQALSEAPAAITDQLDNYLQSAFTAGKFNGVALVAKKGQVVLHKAYGWKNVAAKTYNDTSTVFPILSITKSFTAMVMLRLQEQGKLSLKDKLGKYFPDLPNADKITLKQLLVHTSGLHNYTEDIGEEDSALVNHPVAQAQILELLRKPPMHAPGKDLSYNNSGYYLAGMIIEKASGRSYEQNVRELIFEPLNMKHSGFDFNGLNSDVRATGYQFLNDTLQKPYTFLDSTVGFSAGAIYSTSNDMYKWMRAIAQKGILSASSWKEALSRQAGIYGIGFQLNQFFGNAYVKHSGGYPGFASEFIYYPQQDISIILFRNFGNYGEDLWPVTMGVSSILLGLPYDPWQRRKRVALPEDILKQRAGKYLGANLTIIFKVKDKQLYEVLPNGTELPLIAEDDDTFYLENFNTSIRFTNTDGVETATIHEHGKDYPMKKAAK
ncbi:MAG TPA: serine hydrolase domain-containing protein [Chitinophaga sp.]